MKLYTIGRYAPLYYRVSDFHSRDCFVCRTRFSRKHPRYPCKKKPSSAEERFSLKRRPRLPDPEKSDEIVFDAKK